MPRINYAKTAPEALNALMGVKKYLDQSTIEAPLLALIDLRVSQINGCAFCMDMHSQEARHRGIAQQRLDCLPGWRDAPFYSPRERAALAWAESLTNVSTTGVPDEAFAQVRAEFNEQEIVDLSVAVGMINMWNRLSVGFRSEPPTRREPAASSNGS